MSKFKQQCPGCEELITLDTAMVGKKTTCLSCKFRFIVEDPQSAGQSDDDDDDDAPQKPRKKGGSNNAPLLLAIGGGVIVIGLLLAGAVFWFSGGSGTSAGPAPSASKSSSPGTGDATVIGTPPPIVPGEGGPAMPGMGGSGAGIPGMPDMGGGAAMPGAAAMMNPGGQNPAAAKPAPRKVGIAKVANSTGIDPANFLPADTQAVLAVHLDRARSGPLGAILFNMPGTLDINSMSQAWGLGADQIQQVAVGMNLESPWTFCVFKFHTPVVTEQLTSHWKSKAVKVGGGRDGKDTIHVLGVDLDTSTNVVARLVYLLTPSRRPSGPLAFYQYDANTIILADQPRLESYVKTDIAGLKLEAPPPPEPAEGSGTTVGAGAPSGFPPMGAPLPGGPPGSSGSGPPGGIPGGPPGGIPGGPPGAFPGAPGSGGAPAAVAAPPPPQRYLNLNASAVNALNTVEALSSDAQITFYASPSVLRHPLLHPAIKEGILKPVMSADLLILGVLKPETIELAGSLHQFLPDSVNISVFAGMESPPQAFGGLLLAGLKFMLKSAKLDVSIGTTGAGAAPAGGGLGGPGGSPMPGGFPGGPPMGSPGGFPGSSEGGSPGGELIAPGGIGGPPGGGAPSNTGGAKNGTISFINQKAGGELRLELKQVTPEIYHGLQEYLRGVVVQGRGMAETFQPKNGIGELANALRRYFGEKQQFPRGTSLVPAGTTLRPDMRSSWLLEILPYLTGTDYAGVAAPLILKGALWRDKDFAVVATLHIPAFVNTATANNAPRVQWTSVREPLGATHFVGIAGLGLDSPSLPAGGDAASLGVFGYDRVTKVSDIKDGPENTIAVLQIPSNTQGPWIAGGGSTVRGIPAGPNPLEAFVVGEIQNPATNKKEQGTLAIMADGQVRFIPASMKPEIFRALCTIAGGEKIENLNAVAPLVPSGN